MLKDKKNEVWNIVEIARNKERPNVRFYIENIFDDFIEFHGDRNFRRQSRNRWNCINR